MSSSFSTSRFLHLLTDQILFLFAFHPIFPRCCSSLLLSSISEDLSRSSKQYLLCFCFAQSARAGNREHNPKNNENRLMSSHEKSNCIERQDDARQTKTENLLRDLLISNFHHVCPRHSFGGILFSSPLLKSYPISHPNLSANNQPTISIQIHSSTTFPSQPFSFHIHSLPFHFPFSLPLNYSTHSSPTHPRSSTHPSTSSQPIFISLTPLNHHSFLLSFKHPPIPA